MSLLQWTHLVQLGEEEEVADFSSKPPWPPRLMSPPPPPPPPGTQISISLASCYDAPHSHLQASKDLVSPSSPDRGRRQHASM
mmetsp:Transcript_11098/g.17902  ORF Transcript_11098/g.17902 Transcript_11098/m.17902 type:complete len:83 (-) Transcript_11098:4265-4513(-)